MELCLYTDSVQDLGLDEALDLTVQLGIPAVEIAGGGQSPAPHLDLAKAISDEAERNRLEEAILSRGLRFGALNCSAWPMHPVVDEDHREIIRNVMRLASYYGVKKIVSMSGTPGDGPNATFVNWVWYPWPPEAQALLETQWREAIPVWRELLEFAKDIGVTSVAFELHPLHLVYNVPTLEYFREGLGDLGEMIGANVDPSHMFWQRMDPVAVVQRLGEHVAHVHLKDVSIDDREVALAGVLDNREFGPDAPRAWTFTTVGDGHGQDFWGRFVEALVDVGYDDVLSIENEDASRPSSDGVRAAAEFISPLMPGVPA